MRRADRLPAEFSGERPASLWAELADEARLRRIWDVPDLSEVIGGIVSYLVERLIEPTDPFRVFLLHGGDLHPVRLSDALYLSDPSEAPKHCETKADAAGFAAFYSNRRSQHPFLDRAFWTILNEPCWHLASCEEEAEDMRTVWARLAPFAGASLVYRQAVGWRHRDWKAASQVAKTAEADLTRILDGKIPAHGAGFEEAVQEALLLYQNRNEEQKRNFTYAVLADHFRVDGVPRNNRRLRDLWAALCDRLPPEEAQRLQKPGRRRPPSA